MMDTNFIHTRLLEQPAEKPGSTVLIPLIPHDKSFDILFELRAADIEIQPNEVCLPGGHIEPGEQPLEALLRECEEELLVSRRQIDVLGELTGETLAAGAPFYVFVGVLTGYQGSFDTTEVARTFTVPLEYFLSTQPELFLLKQHMEFPDDFPFDRIPHGKDYPWHNPVHKVPFYLDTDPLIWGLTARVLMRFVHILKKA